MRLINTTTYVISDFSANPTPLYAIFSHTWEDDEVSYQEWLSAPKQKAIRRKAGYKKIIEACKQALSFNYEWIWADTCCIDRSNLADLAGSLNSLYRWYRSAGLCLTYLADVSGSPSTRKTTSQREDRLFRDSQWFTRGWTLQELIAPPVVIFFSSNWEYIGSRATRSVEIQGVTGIDSTCLETNGPVDLSQFSLATRMSWASKRVTTRAEDTAYSLLGILGVNMSIIYGEGNGAFIRLQEEVLKRNSDLSILAWRDSGSYILERPLHSPPLSIVLAPSPTAFASSSRFTYRTDTDPGARIYNQHMNTFSPRGLWLGLPLIQTLCPRFVFGALPCHSASDNSRTLWMPLYQSPGSPQFQWARSVWPAPTIVFDPSHPPVEPAEEPPVPTVLAVEAYSLPLPVDPLGTYQAQGANILRLLSSESHATSEVLDSRLPIIIVAFPRGMGSYTLAKTSNPLYDPQADCAFPLTLSIGWRRRSFAKGHLIFKNPEGDKITVFFAVKFDEGISTPSGWSCRIGSPIPTTGTEIAAAEYQWQSRDETATCCVIMSENAFAGTHGPDKNSLPHFTLIASVYFMPSSDVDDDVLSDSWVKVERPSCSDMEVEESGSV